MDLLLKDKVVVVTGSSAGIGLATACEFAREGAHVVLVGRTQERLRAAAHRLPETAASVLSVACDVTDPDDAARLIGTVVERHDAIDVLVNNVGGAVGGRLIENSTDDHWRRTFEMNVVQTVRLMRLAVPHMRHRAAAIVNIASISGWVPQLASSGQYGGSKAALIFDTERWALEFQKHGVRVNTVAPGAILEEGSGWATYRDAHREAFDAYVEEAFPMGRLGAPQEVADVVVFLASARANWVNGRMVAVDGLEQPVRAARHWGGEH
ncbi:SDR family NAD(P)-dependent oxidoreductase [Ancylobacter amanitiformis]|uniref:3-oxoacyl-[acyl-carrier protein] reductase n=1 Tax=Ancylobacter amanitiformis TaxID=217069 RepID=A0ABU0LVY4_9HYPH|nr:SDR family oxidoreductase [Ancylobacter amanitiformis]MDQ0512892.1 3-oxoacyl-[acyl-carrier protein] reductase [Ancylobacter amanitiformis]